MVDLDRFRDLLDRGTEERFLEYKGSAPWDALKLKLAKTAMAMANLPDGGTIVIGVQRNEGGQYIPNGVTPDHRQTYDPDVVQAFVNKYADPHVRMDVQVVDWDEKVFIEMRVYEFDEIPVLCKCDGDGVRKGALYVRSNRMPETCEVQSQTEMREIMEMATDKGIRKFLARLRAIGVPVETLVEQPDDTAAFEAQLKGL